MSLYCCATEMLKRETLLTQGVNEFAVVLNGDMIKFNMQTQH
jgi:hypothetical protein